MSLNLSKTACWQFNLKNGDIIRGYINNHDEFFFEIKLKNPKDFIVSNKPIDDIIYLVKSEVRNFYIISNN